ncbi:MAG TPA: hypothetical protein VFX37_10650, partial [Pseudolabrys sp.]|nr:hypothetical protein [Pseudolabrys sp.]
GDCGDERIAINPRRKPWGRTPIKSVVACRACDWTWKPTTGFGFERCPRCQKVKSVRDRNYEGKKNIALLKTAKKRKRPGGEWDRVYRRRAALLVGRGDLVCVRCGCNNPKLLEINHKNGGGGKELKELKGKFYRRIAKMERPIDDLELLCRPCNAVHALELKHGPLPFKVIWEGVNES